MLEIAPPKFVLDVLESRHVNDRADRPLPVRSVDDKLLELGAFQLIGSALESSR